MATSASLPFSAFKEALAARIVDNEGLEDFIDYLAALAWDVLPRSLQNATYEKQPTASELETLSLNALPVSFGETLTSYNVLPNADDDTIDKLLREVIADFIADRTAAPPIGRGTRSSVEECEICARGDDVVNLTYHHLIPRSTHALVRKRALHPEERLQAVAWLCRPCHSMVHRVASNEELARTWYTVEKLLEREDVQRWRTWASKQGHRKKR